MPGTIYVPVLPGHLHMRLEGQWIGSGGNSGFQAANLALRWGARVVLLTGMDCAGSHWHGPHAKYGGRDPQDSTRKQWLTAWENAAKAGLPIINCSRFSMIEGLPRKDLADALQDLLGSAALAEAG